MDDALGLAKQTGAGAGGLGTPNLVPSYYLPVVSASPGTNTAEMELAETTGTPFESDPERGVQWFGPTARGAARVASFPRLLSGFFGDPVTTTPGGGVASRQHVHDPVANEIPRAHSILMSRTDPTPAIVDVLSDAVGNELSIDIAPGDDGWLLFDAGWVALGIDEDEAAPSATHDLSRRLSFDNATAHLTIGAGAENPIPVGRFGLRYSLNLPTDQTVLGSRRLYKAPPQRRRVEVSFVPKENLSSYYRRALVLEPESIKLRLEALGPIIEGAIRYKVEVIVHRAFEFTAPADIDGSRSLVEVPVTARAALNPADNKAVTITTVNTVTAY